MKKLGVILAAVSFFTSLSAQNSTHPWAVDLNLNFREYNGDVGNQFFKFNDGRAQPGLGITRYFTPWINARAYVNYGNSKYMGDSAGLISKPVDLRALNIGAQAQFKLNNGKFLKEDVLIAPYLAAGIAYWNFKNNNAPNTKTGVIGIPLSAGLSFNVHPRVNILAQTTYNLNFNDNAENYTYNTKKDNWLQYSVGVGFNFGKGSDNTTTKKKDSDKDGVADEIDRCPNTRKGAKVDEFGCEIVSVDANTELKGIIKNVLFETSSDQLKEESKTELDKVVTILYKFPSSILIIEGHTDNTGTAALNLDLSNRRAESVKAYLVSKGIDAARLIAKGYGQSMPLVSNDTPEGRSLNRRVELILTTK